MNFFFSSVQYSDNSSYFRSSYQVILNFQVESLQQQKVLSAYRQKFNLFLMLVVVLCTWVLLKAMKDFTPCCAVGTKTQSSDITVLKCANQDKLNSFKFHVTAAQHMKRKRTSSPKDVTVFSLQSFVPTGIFSTCEMYRVFDVLRADTTM